MFERGLDLGTSAGLLAGIAYLSLCGKVLAQWRASSQRSALLLAALLGSALWGLGVAAEQAGWLPVHGWAAELALPALDLLRDAAWFAFILELVHHRASAPQRRGWLFWAGAGLVLASLSLVLLSYYSAYPLSTFERPQAMLALALSIYGLVLLEQLLRNLVRDALWNAKPVVLGLAVVFGFDLFLYSQQVLFSSSDLDAQVVRPAVHAMAVPLLWLASRRHPAWLEKLHVSRAAIFHSATLLIVGAYLVLVSGVGYYVRYSGGEWGRALQQVLVALALLAALLVALSGSMRARLRVYISKNFFSYRYDYREEWLRFTAMLSTSESPAQLGESVVRGLANLVESTSGALWLRHASTAELVQVARWNLAAQAQAIAADDPLLPWLAEKGWIVDLDEWRQAPGRYEGLFLPGCLLTEPRPWLLVPLLNAGELTGLVVLGQPRTRIELDWEVRDLLRTASSQAASYLAQMQATEALLEARKFEAFNRMSAFVVHDLKNIVTQLSLMMKNAKRLRDNPEFQQDMLDTVENSLDKMRQLMLQLREGAKPHGVSGGVDLAQIAQRLAKAAAGKGRELELQVQAPLSARGQEERIERVLGHVVQNALDATPLDGRVWLRLERQGSNACVEVGDTGCGMTQEFMDTQLFKPFQTTKAAGMGIGAYESFQYLQELGGKISVQSAPGQGTRVSIRLPLFLAQEGSDASLSGA